MDAGTVIGTVVVVIVTVIGIQVVSAVLANAAFTGILKTVTDNIPVFMGIGGLIASIAWALM